MNGSCLLFLVLVLLSGCMESSTPDQAVQPETSVDDPLATTALHTQGWHNETFTTVQYAAGHYGQGSNCAHFERQDLLKIHSGWANVSWTSPSPLAETMRFTVIASKTLEVVGTSPLSMNLGQLLPHDLVDVIFWLQTSMDAGVDLEIDMQMEWSFLYDGVNPLPFQKYGCG